MTPTGLALTAYEERTVCGAVAAVAPVLSAQTKRQPATTSQPHTRALERRQLLRLVLSLQVRSRNKAGSTCNIQQRLSGLPFCASNARQGVHDRDI